MAIINIRMRRCFLAALAIAAVLIHSARTELHTAGLSGSASDQVKVRLPDGSTLTCEKPATRAASIDPALIQAGTFDFVMVRRSQFGTGGSVVGALTLVEARPDDVSPRTKERPDPLSKPRLIGSLRIELGVMGYVIEKRSGIPGPESTDPVYPGVIVFDEVPSLSINSYANIRSKLHVVADGPGVYMIVMRAGSSEFSGSWGSGILVNGPSGFFCARHRPAH